SMRSKPLLLPALPALVLSWAACSPHAPEPPGAAAPSAVPAMRERDYERVREAVARGEMVPLETILADAQRRQPGQVLEVELEGDEYEIEILGADGVVRELEYDARTGELLDVEVDD